jgi:7,8-dihydropterin-6-yl-methyl-4-(beta-D-ribofuranosyl)aminobenzene 5'-phosphate synthase
MDVTITLLSDNAVNTRGLLAEHGLSILLERANQQLLFDVGQGESAVHNARVLGITFHSPLIVLSHGHYDHTGGLTGFSRILPKTAIFAHSDVFRQRFSTKATNDIRDVSAPFKKEELEREGFELRLDNNPQEVLERVWTTGQIARPFAADQALTGLSVDVAGRVPDDVLDDIAVVVEGSKQALLLLGCAHAGVRNTILQVEAMTEKPLRGIVGGLHLENARQRDVRALGVFLCERGVEFVAASHCTGCEAAHILGNYVECTLTVVGSRLRFDL